MGGIRRINDNNKTSRVVLPGVRARPGLAFHAYAKYLRVVRENLLSVWRKREGTCMHEALLVLEKNLITVFSENKKLVLRPNRGVISCYRTCAARDLDVAPVRCTMLV